MYGLSNPLFRTHRISIRTKINMYRALVVSVLFYGSESLSTTLADRRRLDVFNMRCQRCLLRVFWQQHISNRSIREHTKQPTASSLLGQRRLRWFGHLLRMPSSLPVRRVYDFNPNIHGWKRPRGCSNTRWADSIKHDLHSAGLDTTNSAQMVCDRPQWKAFDSGLSTLVSLQQRRLARKHTKRLYRNASSGGANCGTRWQKSSRRHGCPLEKSFN